MPYQEEWAHRFHISKQEIIGILLSVDIECDVRHVGSTAIPGMISKPIVDVLVMVSPSDLENAMLALSEYMKCLGECGRPGRYFFSDGDTEQDAVYIHLTTPDNPVAVDQLRFLKLLQSAPELQRIYTFHKQLFAEHYPHDRTSYRAAKGVFIQELLAHAASNDDTSIES